MPRTTYETAHGRRAAITARLAPCLLLLVALMAVAVLTAAKWTIGPSPAADYIYVNTNAFYVLVNTHCVYNV
jgi:hypothetical protein